MVKKKNRLKYNHIMSHSPQLFDTWCTCRGSPSPCPVICLCPSHSPHSKPLSSFQRAAIFQKQIPCHKNSAFLLCVSESVFSAAVSKKKKRTFFMGTNVESRYMQSESSSRLQYMSFSMHLKKSRTLHTGTGKCMKMSLSFDCSSCLLTWSLASRDCLGRLYSITDIQYLLSKRETTCKMSSSCGVSSK